MRTCPASWTRFEDTTWLPMWQSCPTWLPIRSMLSSPIEVTPPPPAVPAVIVTCSRIWLRAPITTRTGSPLYLRSCGSSPIDVNEKMVVSGPISVWPVT